VGGASDGEVEGHLRTVARVSTYLWDDENGSTPEVQDSSDTGISGVQVRYVWAGTDGTVDTTPQDATPQHDDRIYLRTSTSTGVSTVIGLTPDNYELQIANPPSTAPEAVSPSQGSDPYKDSNGSQPAGPGEPTTISFTIPDPISLSTNENGNTDDPGALYGYPDIRDELSYDFGFRKTTRVAVGNTLWHDANGNGIKDGGEAGIGGITVRLYRDTDGDGVCEPGSDTLVQTKTSDSNGTYTFRNLAPSDAADATTYYGVAVNKSDVTAAGYAYSSAGGDQNPDAVGDQDAASGDDGIPSGNDIVSKPFAATVHGQTNTGDSGDPSAYPDDSSYMTVDFGFLTQADYNNMSSPNAVVLQDMEARADSMFGLTGLILLGLMGIGVLLWRRRTVIH
jgi:hypothetical protein